MYLDGNRDDRMALHTYGDGCDQQQYNDQPDGAAYNNEYNNDEDGAAYDNQDGDQQYEQKDPYANDYGDESYLYDTTKIVTLVTLLAAPLSRLPYQHSQHRISGAVNIISSIISTIISIISTRTTTRLRA
jgi:hypothetical protein